MAWGDVFHERCWPTAGEQQVGCVEVKVTDAGLQQGSPEEDMILSNVKPYQGQNT